MLRGDGINNIHEGVHNGEFNLLFLEPMKHIKTISDLCPSNNILVCDGLGINHIQKDCFRRKIVPVVRVVMKVEGLLVVAH